MNDAWDRFLTAIKGNGQSSAAAWSETYRSGGHSLWDHASPSTELIAYILGARLPPGARVLDVGCGTGADAIFLAKQNYEVHGLDFSGEALRHAERRARECGVVVDWRECSASDTPFGDAYFDLITDRGCCHHMGGALRQEYAREIARILKPGGVLFLRGNRNAEHPFFPINRDSLHEVFDLQHFEIGPDFPFFYAVDTGGIYASVVTIVRRDSPAVRNKRSLSFLKRVVKATSPVEA